MISRSAFRFILVSSLLFALSGGIRPASASPSHARIIRISVVQGDVRFTRETHGDPLADTKAVWEKAEANLPVRQGYVLATDEGRAEVEFENGAMAFLNANTVLEFYDLSLDDGARTTRLVLRQGSASFYVNSLGEDYFSVTGGDFTVVAASKGSFRVNNFDDGSNVAVLTGRVSVLHKKETTSLVRGQSLAMKAGEASVSLGRVPEGDDFDHWVSGRIDTVSSASNASLQYTGSSFYAPGFASLYTYGAWNLCGSYGYGWRPFGAGFGWSPFTSGQWVWDPSFGWTYMSYQPWGWAPYHYGGWLFDASCGGWFYSPPVVFFNPYGPYGSYPGNPKKRPVPIVHPPHPLYRASTAVFVRQNGKLGIVPMNPLDKQGKTPLNLVHGVFSPESARPMTQPLLASNGSEKWETVKSPSRDALPKSLVSVSAPDRTVRTMWNNNGARSVSLNGNSSIIYDSQEHRFASANALSPAQRDSRESLTNRNSEVFRNSPAQRPGTDNPRRAANARAASVPASARVVAPPSRSVQPPPARSYGGGSFGSYSGGGASSRGSSAPVSSPHVSAPSGGGGGGRPH